MTTATAMLNSEELDLLSCSLIAMKDLMEADLLLTSDVKFLDQVRADIVEINALQTKIQSMMM